MGTDHGKKIKTPLRKPKVIDKIGSKEKLSLDLTPQMAMKEFDKLMNDFKKFEKQTKKSGVKKKAKESSKKTTITFFVNHLAKMSWLQKAALR